MIPDEIAPKPEFHSTRPVVLSKGGAIVAGSPLGAGAGAMMLERGGNAMDAAIAAALVQAVVMPHLSGFGGDLFILHRSATTGSVSCLNGAGPSPAGATLEAFQQRGLWEVPARGIESASVPGAVDGWFRALKELGTMSLAEVFAPALDYARNGFPVHKNFIRYLMTPAYQQARKISPSLDKVYFPGGKPPEFGMLLRQPALADMIERLIANGPEEFYRGETAAMIDRESKRHDGFLGREDLARYASQWVKPLSVSYRGYEVYQVPPNSQGITMLQQLRALEQFDLAALGHNTPDYIDLLAHAKRAAFADRNTLVADPDVVSVPIEEMLSDQRAAAFSKSYRGGGRRLPKAAATRRPTGDTTALAVVDAEGNAVSLIQSLFDDFGGGIFVADAGFALQNRMCGFSLEPGHLNVAGPNKRPLHTLCTSIVTHNGKLFMSFVTPAGHAQTQTLVQILNNIVVFGMDAQEAVEAPRWIDEQTRILMESRFPAAIGAAMEARGHNIEWIPPWSGLSGGASAIVIHPEAGTRMAGADPRRDSYAIPV
jgi:gamma-glutamyltranspeptidase/glutathione hydrolase